MGTLATDYKSMSQTSIRVYLSVFGDSFDLTALTTLVGVDPTETGIKGQPIVGRRTTYKETYWDLSVGPTESLDLAEVYEALLNKLNGSEEAICQFMSANHLSAKFNIVIDIVNGRTPGLYFNRAFLNSVEMLQAEVDIDTYVTQVR